MAERVELSLIRTDGGTQPRAAIDVTLVETYAADMGRGDPFPPPVVFFDGADYWLADGFHRVNAAAALKRDGLLCEVRQGTQRDAILYSVGANDSHGLRRTNEDKRRAVLRLLNDPEWSVWGDREIARACRVGHPLVASLRPTPPADHLEEIPDRPRTVQRAGSTYTMNTAPIGRRAEPAAPPERPPLPPVTQPTAGPIRQHAFAAARSEMDQNGPIFDAIEAIKREFQKLPMADEAARRFPTTLRHTFSPAQADHIAEWFRAFGEAWVHENGEPNVIAAE